MIKNNNYYYYKNIWKKKSENADSNHKAKHCHSLHVLINIERLAPCLERSKIWRFPKFRRNSIPQSWKSNKSIFGEIEILVSKWSWQNQLFQCNKIVTPNWPVFTQYTNVRSLPATSILYCTDVLSNTILTLGLRRGSFVLKATKS